MTALWPGEDIVWMHAATRRRGYPADSSDLAAGAAAGASTSTPSLLQARSNRGQWLTPSPITAGDPASRCVVGQCHLPRQCDLPALRLRRAPARAPLGRRVRPPTVSAQANCDRPRLPPVRHSLSPLARPRGRLCTVSAQADCVGPSTPPDFDSLNPRGRAPTVSAKGYL